MQTESARTEIMPKDLAQYHPHVLYNYIMPSVRKLARMPTVNFDRLIGPLESNLFLLVGMSDDVLMASNLRAKTFECGDTK
jgi:hypothetical protein